MSQEEDIDVFHLGNSISIHFKSGEVATGTIVFRDNDKIYLKSQDASDRATEYKFNEEGDDLLESYEIESITLIDIVEIPQFVRIFGLTEGAYLEFFTLDGQKAAEDGTVESVNVKKDRIVLTDKRTYSFRAIGAPDPIAVIRVSSQAPEESQAKEVEKAEEKAEKEEDPEFLQWQQMLAHVTSSLPPASAIEMIQTADLTYPESMQRSDMLQDILAINKANRAVKMTPHLLRRIEREVDVIFNLKGLMTKFDDAGNIVGIIPNVINTFGDAITLNSRIPAAIPVVAGALVVNVDELVESFRSTDVKPQLIQDSETAAVASNEAFNKTTTTSSAPGGVFSMYMNGLLSEQTFVNPTATTTTPVDQDVIRTAELETSVQGFGSKLPSGAEGKEGIPKLTTDLIITNVQNRLIRLLKSDAITLYKTGEKIKVAPGDPAMVLSYMILPAKIALALRPQTRLNGNLQMLLNAVDVLESDNQPTVTDALFSLSSLDKDDPLKIWSVTPEEAATTELAPWLENVLKYAIHKSDSLSLKSPKIQELLDSVGLISSELDLSAPIRELLDAWVLAAQAEWRQIMESIKTSDIAPSVVDMPGHDNVLWALLREDEHFREQQAEIKQQNPLIAESPTLQAAIFSSIFQGDYAPLVWSAVRKLSYPEQGEGQQNVAALAAIQLSKLFKEKRSVITNLKLTALDAGPEINTCPHVTVLEAIRNTASMMDRSRLLNNFIEQYQGSQNGEWLTCSLCSKNAVCKHEIMELEMLAQPSRFDALQRQMFIRFGGERYLGSIVCRNCGQALKEIDFDDNVEFDDNGKPIIQNAVVTEEEMENDTNDEKVMKALQEEFAPELTFDTVNQRDFHEILIMIANRTGVQLTPEVTREIVTRADVALTKLFPFPNEEIYERAISSQKTKAKSSQTPVKYIVFKSILQVNLVAALLVIALQSATPVLKVSASQYCTYSQAGYPLEAAKPIDEASTLLYVACCISYIDRDENPWKWMPWRAKQNIAARQKEAYERLKMQLEVLFTKAQLPFMSEVKAQLEAVRSDVRVQQERTLISKTDTLSPGFRPQPFPAARADRNHSERPVNAQLQDGRLIKSLQERAAYDIVEFHQKALTANVPISFREFAQHVMEAPNNTDVVTALLLKQVNPPSAGTHLFSNFAPVGTTESQSASSVDESSIFRIFLRFCHSGPKVGAPHEIDVGYKCRQCGFVIGPPKDINDFGSEAELIEYQKQLIQTAVTAESFNAVSNAVRRYGIIPPVANRRSSSGTDKGLRRLLACLEETGASSVADAFRKIVDGGENGSNGSNVDEIDEAELAERWSAFSVLSDTLTSLITEKLMSVKIRGRNPKPDAIQRLLAHFDTLLADPWIEGPSQIQEYWCAKVSAAASGVSITAVKGQIWSLLAREHREDVDKLVKANAEWTEEEVTPEMGEVLTTLASRIAPCIRVWKTHVRASKLLTTEYARLFLKTIVLNAWYEALDSGGVEQQIALWTINLIIHSGEQTIRFSAEEIKRVLQERAAKERVTIVKEFEDAGDQDSRAVMLLLKQHKIGRWGEGKNLTKYDKERYVNEKEQRGRMDVMDSTVAGAANPASTLGIDLDAGDLGEMTAGGGEFEGED